MMAMQQAQDDYRLTTAEILYHLPDHPNLLQTFIWQDLDIAVAHESHDALVAALTASSSRWHIRLNSFGGVKATLPSSDPIA